MADDETPPERRVVRSRLPSRDLDRLLREARLDRWPPVTHGITPDGKLTDELVFDNAFDALAFRIAWESRHG